MNSIGKVILPSVIASLLSGALVMSAWAADTLRPGAGVSITPAFPTIDEERFRGEIAVLGLEALGYDVKEAKETEFPTLYIALAYGDADFTVHNWEVLHNDFYRNAGGDKVMTKVGQVMTGVLQGYMIDKQTAEAYDIKDLGDLKKPEIAKLFDSNGDGKADLTACNPGWGCELIIDHHMSAYGLKPTVVDNRGSYFALMADTIARFNQGQPVLFYTWTPQWISNVLVEGRDVVWLPVPFTSLPNGKNDTATVYNGKNLGFPLDTVNAVMNKEFADKNPAAAKFLSLYKLEAADESAQNYKMQQGEKSRADIKRQARAWVEQHRTEFDRWLTEARAASR